ncbi:MAG: glycosyltransferase family 4 protein [Patescibacteria group bacterium]|nr:glycosyltransferase family 4 protein [Patescibacteria group bacterium]
MRILHVNKFFDFRDGTDIYIHRLMEKQAAAGHDAHIMATASEKNIETPDSRLFVRRHDFSRSEGFERDVGKAMNFIWNREAKAAMAKALDEYKPDLVHLHNIYHHLTTSVLQPVRRRRIPCVQTLHDYKLACPNYKMFTEGAPCERCKGGHYLEAVRHHCLGASFAPNILAACEMGMTKFTQAYERSVKFFICPTDFVARKMREWGEPPSKTVVVHNPVDASSDTVEGGEDFILFIGRLSEEKGVDVLIRAAARVPELELKIAGAGPQENALKELAKSLKAENVSFLGFLRQEQLKELRKNARAMAVPSVWYENAPLAVLEAMAHGLPVIASRIGGLPELVDEGKTGWLVTAQDVDAWVAALKAVLAEGRGEWEKMSRASKERASDVFGWEKHLAELESIYRKAGA